MNKQYRIKEYISFSSKDLREKKETMMTVYEVYNFVSLINYTYYC